MCFTIRPYCLSQTRDCLKTTLFYCYTVITNIIVSSILTEMKMPNATTNFVSICLILKEIKFYRFHG